MKCIVRGGVHVVLIWCVACVRAAVTNDSKSVLLDFVAATISLGLSNGKPERGLHARAEDQCHYGWNLVVSCSHTS